MINAEQHSFLRRVHRHGPNVGDKKLLPLTAAQHVARQVCLGHGLVTRDKIGRYTITEAGLAALDEHEGAK